MLDWGVDHNAAGQGTCTCRVVVVVVDTAGRGVTVVVCSVVLVRVTGDDEEQPAKIAAPATSAVLNARLKRDVFVIWYLSDLCEIAVGYFARRNRVI